MVFILEQRSNAYSRYGVTSILECTFRLRVSDALHLPLPTQARLELGEDAQPDCFYVYPTISYDKLPNSDLMTNPFEEELVAREQLRRFAAVCRGAMQRR
jgi:hypothetical protein